MPDSSTATEFFPAPSTSFSLEQIHSHIRGWMLSDGPTRTFHASHFKPCYNHYSKSLPPPFIASWLLYAFMAKLRPMIKDCMPAKVAQANLELKNQFRGLEGFASDNAFKFLVTYSVKVMSAFLKRIIEIQVDYTLESELCIIFYHVIIGIQVGTKTLAIVQKPFLVQCARSTSKTIDRDVKLVRTTCKLIQSSKKLKKPKYRPTMRQSIHTGGSHSEAQSFIEDIRDNLYVDPLPPIERKHLKIRDYEALHPADTAYDPTNLKTYIYSNQLSASMHFNSLQRSLHFERGHPVKINRSKEALAGQISTASIFQLKQSAHLSMPACHEERSAPDKRQLTDWNEVIGSLKKKAFHRKKAESGKENCLTEYRCHQHRTCTQKPPSPDLPPTTTPILDSPVPAEVLITGELKPVSKIADSGFLNVQNFESKAEVQPSKGKNRLVSIILRANQVNFAQLCKQRSSQISYEVYHKKPAH